MKTTCLKCGNEFSSNKSAKRKYCSYDCYWKDMVGKHHGHKTNDGRIAWNHGLTGFNTGENHPRWRGDNVNYFALHHWVSKYLGKPVECVYCGETERRLHWASISHKAKRDLNDYIPLCASCHKGYDRKGGD